MLRQEEIEAIAHNVARMYVEIGVNKLLEKEIASPSLKSDAMAKSYLKIYLSTKKIAMEYVHEQKLQEDKQNPFSNSYEHPKLDPYDKTQTPFEESHYRK